MTGWHHHPAVRSGGQLTLGERAADRMRNGMGSWPFVFAALLYTDSRAASRIEELHERLQKVRSENRQLLDQQRMLLERLTADADRREQ